MKEYEFTFQKCQLIANKLLIMDFCGIFATAR